MNGSLIRRDLLSPDDVAAMYALLSAHFEGTTVAGFEADLKEKNWVIILRDDHGRIAGFSTILAYESCCTGSPVSIICSGDTIVDPSAWRSSALPQSWIRSVHELRRHYPRGPFYWLLIASGFRTYRFLPVFWRRFTPSVHEDATPQQLDLLQALAAERFGSAFDPTTGLVRLARPQRLRPHLASIPPGRTFDPHIAYFLARNPSHACGDEIACLTSLEDANLTAAGRRMAFGAPAHQAIR